MAVTLNASTSTGYIQTADTSGDLALQSNGTTQFTVASTGAYGQLKSGTAVASTSGTSIDFTSIPSWVKRITVMLNGVSTNGTSEYLLQLGDSGGVETTGYTGVSARQGAAGNVFTTSTAGFPLTDTVAAANLHQGLITVCLIGANAWVVSGLTSFNGAASSTATVSGGKTLSDTLDRIRITTVGGVNTFDAGTINILYEG
jgi:hypothetical protein